ncbi:MAG: hypothetical protein FK733_14765 [Asgard group archaeon]|nr:hypothetical protein [Asgard group archaeon]
MRKKNLNYIIVLVCILLLSVIKPIHGASKIILDDTQDVYHTVYNPQNPERPITAEKNIDRYPEIDIESIEINVTTIVITYVGVPNASWVHYYDFIIRWNGDDVDNITNGIWDDNHKGIATQLYDESDQEIAKSQEFDTVEVIGTSLVFPLLNGSLISNVLNPRKVEITTRFQGFESGIEGSFRDILTYKSKGLPGYSVFVTIFGLSTIVLITYIKRRK